MTQTLLVATENRYVRACFETWKGESPDGYSEMNYALLSDDGGLSWRASEVFGLYGAEGEVAEITAASSGEKTAAGFPSDPVLLCLSRACLGKSLILTFRLRRPLLQAFLLLLLRRAG